MSYPPGLDEIKDKKMSDWFQRFAGHAEGSPMYQYLSAVIAKDAELLKLAQKADQTQPVPNLFFAAVNFLLYKDSSAKLCKLYPNHSGNAFSPSGFFEVFKEFCLKNSEKMTEIMSHRLVQTNEVRRCALLLPAIASFMPRGAETALIDVGASAGLNLLLDHYCYEYSDGTKAGPQGSPLKISCEMIESHFPLVEMPKISMRTGIDRHPIDLNDNEEMLWALSLLWPDQPERIDRLKSAVEVLKNQPVDIRQGDAVSVLASVVKEYPKHLHICVMHSFTLNQFSTEDRAVFERELCELSKERDIRKIGLEWLGTENPEISAVHFSAGKIQSKKTMAVCHQHGAWMKWLS